MVPEEVPKAPKGQIQWGWTGIDHHLVNRLRRSMVRGGGDAGLLLENHRRMWRVLAGCHRYFVVVDQPEEEVESRPGTVAQVVW
jgi:hypothetical protein